MTNQEELKPVDSASDIKKQTIKDSEGSSPQNQKIVLEMSMDTKDGQLFQLEESSLIALREIAQKFQQGRLYREREINEILKQYYDDHITLRRFLIEYGFLARKPDGSQYWLK
ncbi:MAG: DUF2087 domain-containing protein [Bacillota bacterium]